MRLKRNYLVSDRNDLEVTCILNHYFIKVERPPCRFLSVFAFLRFDYGARALIANYRGQTGGHLVPGMPMEVT